MDKLIERLEADIRKLKRVNAKLESQACTVNEEALEHIAECCQLDAKLKAANAKIAMIENGSKSCDNDNNTDPYPDYPVDFKKGIADA